MTKVLNKKLLLYTAIAYSITWIIGFGIFSRYEKGEISDYQLNLYHAFAALGPAIAAFVTTYLFYGTPGINKLLGKIGLRALDKKTIFFIVSPLVFFGIGLIIYPFVKSTAYSFRNFANLNWNTPEHILVWSLPLLTYAVFEEIGWRGFLLPHLQEKFTAWKATVVLTIIWALWHTPFFFYRFDFSLGISIGFFFGIFVGAIILTSIYNSGRGMLLPAILFHFLNNLCSEFDKEIIVAVLSTGFVFIAIFIYKEFGKEDLSARGRIKNYFVE